MENIVELKHLEKSFGKTTVLRDLQLQIPKDSVYGLIGRNGAGKTTILKMILGLLKPDQGSMMVLGQPPWGMDSNVKEHIGYMPETSFLFPWMRVIEILYYVSSFYPNWDHPFVEKIARQFELPLNQKVNSLSQGQRRTVSFLLAIGGNPDLLILDEPAAHLDVVTRRRFMEILMDWAHQKEKTVIISSHILTDLERIIEKVCILDKGNLKVERSLDDLKENVKRVHLFFEDSAPKQMDIPHLIRKQQNDREMRLTVDHFQQETIEKYLRGKNVRFEFQAIGLEEIFIDFTDTNNPEE